MYYVLFPFYQCKIVQRFHLHQVKVTEFNSPSQFYVQRIDEQASSKLPRVSSITYEMFELFSVFGKLAKIIITIGYVFSRCVHVFLHN